MHPGSIPGEASKPRGAPQRATNGTVAYMTEFTDARRRMIDSQLRPTDVVRQDLLNAMLMVERERFVPEGQAAFAYVDREVPLSGSRRLMAPSPFARLVQLSGLAASDRALVIGAGTGYSAAVLSPLCASVVAVEEDAGLANAARVNLAGLGNVKVVEGALTAGSAADGPFDVILVEGAVECDLALLQPQLADGGRIVAVEGQGQAGTAVVGLRDGAVVAMRRSFNAAVPPVPGFGPSEGFAF